MSGRKKPRTGEPFVVSGDAKERRQQIAELAKLAQGGDHSLLPAIREMVDKENWLVDGTGNLAVQVQASWIKAYTDGNLLYEETVERKLRELRNSLGGPNPSALEMLLVERILACWLQANYLETLYAQRMGSREARTWPDDEGHQRRQDRAHRRFLSAVKTLAVVRRLALPAVQVNIGEKQINVVD